MQRLTNWLAWVAVAVIAGLAALNWSILVTPAPIDLLVARIEAPLGLVMLGLTALLVALFLVATLRNQISALLENRRLLKEIQRVQSVADEAEASRMKALQRLIETEFRRIDERLNSLRALEATSSRPPQLSSST
jgi:hypothetical protein